MIMIEKIARAGQLTSRELEHLEDYDRKSTKHFRSMASKPQSALAAQRSGAVLGATSGGTLANLLARGSKYTRRHKGIATALGVVGGALATGSAGMMAQKSKRQAAKMFPGEKESIKQLRASYKKK